MQIIAATKRFADKHYYQLDSLKLSTDQKQYFNRARENNTLNPFPSKGFPIDE